MNEKSIDKFETAVYITLIISKDIISPLSRRIDAKSPRLKIRIFESSGFTIFELVFSSLATLKISALLPPSFVANHPPHWQQSGNGFKTRAKLVPAWNYSRSSSGAAIFQCRGFVAPSSVPANNGTRNRK